MDYGKTFRALGFSLAGLTIFGGFGLVVVLVASAFTGGAILSPAPTPAPKATATDCIPEVEGNRNESQEFMVRWAMDSIYANAPSPEWWCNFDVTTLGAYSVSDNFVYFEIWTTLDVNSAATYERLYEICRVFIEPFEKRGVYVKLRGEKNIVEVSLDGRETIRTSQQSVMDGAFESGAEFSGGCEADVWFPHVAEDLEQGGWREGNFVDGDKSYDLFSPSERKDFYCNYRCE